MLDIKIVDVKTMNNRGPGDGGSDHKHYKSRTVSVFR
jgi:hypothetical protein